MRSYSLIERPVFPVEGPHGRERLGIYDTLVRAHELRLAFADPLLQVTSVRFLLAIVLDALEMPDMYEWEDRWAAGRYDAEAMGTYLAQHRQRFDLFGDQPAWQVSDLTSRNGETKPSSLLIPSMSTGNNVPLFSSRTEADPPPLDPANAALAVMALHAWDTAAIKTGASGDPAATGGKTTGNPVGTLGQLGVIIPTGTSLFQTLMLNTPTSEFIEDLGTPWWRRDPETAQWQIREPDGLLDLLTWQSRRVRLFPEEGEAGETVIRQVLVCAGDRLASIQSGIEIHTAWRAVSQPKADEPPRRPKRHQSGRALWRGLGGLLAVQEASSEQSGLYTSILLEQLGELADAVPANFPLGILGVGVEYGNQSAIVEDIYVDQIPLPVRALGMDTATAELLRGIADDAENLRQALNHLADNVRRATGGDGIPWGRSQRPGDQMMSEFDSLVRLLLSEAQLHPDRLAKIDSFWCGRAYEIAIRAADPVVDATADNGFLGRGEKGGFISVPLAENYYRGRVRKTLKRGLQERKTV